MAALNRRLQSSEAMTVFVHARARVEALAQILTQSGWSARAHSACLNRTERLATDAAFRTGEIDPLVCTPTLEPGVNFPAEDRVLYDTGGTRIRCSAYGRAL